MTKEWLLWRDTVHDPFFNMSRDDVLLETAGNPAFRIAFRKREIPADGSTGPRSSPAPNTKV